MLIAQVEVIAIKRLLLSEVESDVCLAQDIVDNYGKVLLTAGTYLTAQYIKILNQHDIRSVWIRTNNHKLNNHTILHVENAINPAMRLKLMYAVQNAFRGTMGLRYHFEELAGYIRQVASCIMRREDVFIYLQQLSVKNNYLYMHSVDVGIYSMIIGKVMNLPPEEIFVLGMGGILHDVGKLNIPNSILDKPGALTDEEFKLVQEHSVIGYHLLRQYPRLDHRIILMVLQHHERYDGSGYPWGIAAKHTHSLAQIVAVADVYDALTTDRVYRKHKSSYEAMKIINADDGIKFNPQVVSAFNKVCVPFNIGSSIQLSNGMHGVVVRINSLNPARPVLKTKAGVLDLLQKPEVNVEKAV